MTAPPWASARETIAWYLGRAREAEIRRTVAWQQRLLDPGARDRRNTPPR